MKNQNKGIVIPVIIVAVVIVIGGGIYYLSQKKSEPIAPVASDKAQVQTQVVATTTPSSVASTTKPVAAPAPKPAPQAAAKNTYTNTAGAYSIDLPQGWVARPDASIADPNEPQVTHTSFDLKGQSQTDAAYSFDIQTATTKHQIDYYVQQYHKTPTNDDLFNGFVEDQKSAWDGFKLIETHKVMINGVQAYEMSSTFSDGGGTQRFYVFYTDKNFYIIMIQATTATWKDNESMLLGIVGSFKVK